MKMKTMLVTTTSITTKQILYTIQSNIIFIKEMFLLVVQ